MQQTKPAVATGGHREIVIRDWKPYDKGTLRGFVTAHPPRGMILHGLMLHERNGARWIGMPAREYLDSAGAKQYARWIEFQDRVAADRHHRGANLQGRGIVKRVYNKVSFRPHQPRPVGLAPYQRLTAAFSGYQRQKYV